MEKPPDFILIILGASGDLTRRKIIPALFNLFCQHLLPENFAILGVSRTYFSDHSFREHVLAHVQKCKDKKIDKKRLKKFSNKLFYQPINTIEVNDYPVLKNRLLDITRNFKIKKNFIFYLSIIPSIYEVIINNLGIENLQIEKDGEWRRIVVEKPFGYDFKSASALNRCLIKVFNENQIYRIDHYLGKETVQNVLAFRFANGIFEPLWNRNHIDHIEITSAEFIGIEERGKYYDHTGALRDMVQNHLLQLLGMIAMEPPSSFSANTVRGESLKVFQSLQPLKVEAIEKYVIRGQYTESIIRGGKIRAYRSEKNVDRYSKTETYVALRFYIDNWRWHGVPFYLRTGKRMPTSVTEIVINFRQTPHYLFGKMTDPNQLIIRIQPDEGILLKFGMKLPGTGFQIKNVDMNFHYSNLSDTYIPESYERLLLDCMTGDQTLFIRGDATEACWKFIDPIIYCWEINPKIKIYGYPAGTWGPREASFIFEGNKSDWRYPCKNLVGDGLYCEL
jgi:glucose-6-phosphate 1-dehydrogenase